MKLNAILLDVVPLETTPEETENRLEELENLINTYGGISVQKVIQKRDIPDYSTYIGRGKLNEVIELARENDTKLIILNNILKSRQIFEIQEIFRKAKHEVKVWDRVDLILKIFDKHAQSAEAHLQIELAGLHHMGARIYGMGIELSRQAGAMGVRAGQGESNIEMMKRHLREQELNIIKKLKHYETIRQSHRQRRKRHNFKTVALVGYTNAGKSSLLNALTNKGAYVADKLFATLDTRIGKIYIPSKGGSENYTPGTEILVSDTIGFIQDLPPSLIQAFKSTLSETIEADLILHVIDINDRHLRMKINVVEDILKQLGAENKPKIYVFNKIDLVPNEKIIEEEEQLSLTDEDLQYINEDGKPKGMLKAGKRTAHILGWASHEKREKEKQKRLINDPKTLAKKYREFNPVFVSASQKINMDGLIESVNQKFLPN